MFVKRSAMQEVLWIAGVLLGWILLQTWILPKLGVST
jgi:hypothetical protein